MPKINAAIAASNPRHSFGNNSKNKTNIAKPILSISLLTSSFQYTHHDVLYNSESDDMLHGMNRPFSQ